MVEELEVLVSDPVLDVSLATGEEVVCDGDLVPVHHEAVNQVRTHEASAPCDQNTLTLLVVTELHLRELLLAASGKQTVMSQTLRC